MQLESDTALCLQRNDNLKENETWWKKTEQEGRTAGYENSLMAFASKTRLY